MGLEAGGEINFTANDGVIHPVFAAKISDGTVAGVDANARFERLVN